MRPSNKLFFWVWATCRRRNFSTKRALQLKRFITFIGARLSFESHRVSFIALPRELHSLPVSISPRLSCTLCIHSSVVTAKIVKLTLFFWKKKNHGSVTSIIAGMRIIGSWKLNSSHPRVYIIFVFWRPPINGIPTDAGKKI